MRTTISRQGGPHPVAVRARESASVSPRCGYPACPRPGRARQAAAAQNVEQRHQVSGSTFTLTGDMSPSEASSRSDAARLRPSHHSDPARRHALQIRAT